jgi:hypothetical protein
VLTTAHRGPVLLYIFLLHRKSILKSISHHYSFVSNVSVELIVFIFAWLYDWIMRKPQAQESRKRWIGNKSTGPLEKERHRLPYV